MMWRWLIVIAGFTAMCAILFHDVYLPGAPAIGPAPGELVDQADDFEGDHRD
jgi:hypothetical protein